jgi:GNAT superfamily N-acetyltransferase
MSPGKNRPLLATAARWRTALMHGRALTVARPNDGQDKGRQAPASTSGGATVSAEDAAFTVSDVDDGISQQIDDELYAFNVKATGHSDLRLLRVIARQDNDDLIAGLCGATWGGCGFIDLIWVRPDSRRHGLGARILAVAENEVRNRGCRQLALSTYSFQAPSFYEKAGYRECGRRSDVPQGFEQIHFVKQLDLATATGDVRGSTGRCPDHRPGHCPCTRMLGRTSLGK